MTATVTDPRQALSAGPLLAAFNRAGVLGAADVHVARRLGRLGGEPDERVLLAVALAVRAVRSGAVCVTLDDRDLLSLPEGEEAVAAADLPWPDDAAWRAALAASPLVATGVDGDPDRPTRWLGGRLYLDRYWRDERLVRAEVDARLTGTLLPVDAELLSAQALRLFPAATDARHRLAAAAAALGRVTVVTGGPGTGKTTTVARLLAVLQSVAGPQLRVALAAPTGKAAARLQEAVRAQVELLEPGDQRRVGRPEATTVHRLLGWQPGSRTRFRHDRRHRLPHDVVVVDETSMVSLPLMARLLEALRPQARLVLVGDPDQLASVEAGAVLGDLVGRPPVGTVLPAALARLLPGDLPTDDAGDDLPALANGVVRLDVVHRFDGAIGELAAAVRAGSPDDVLAVLRSGDAAVSFVETAGEAPTADDVVDVRADAEAAGVGLVAAALRGDIPAALAALAAHRLLLAHRRGPFGVGFWAEQVEAWVRAAAGAAGRAADGTLGGGPFVGGPFVGGPQAIGRAGDRTHDRPAGPWYPGRPVLVTANDRDTGLYNGDTGVVVAGGPGEGLVVAFGDPAAPLLVRPHRLPAVETVHAMTVHRGQGSQFASVSVMLPPPTSPLLSRELFYTAVTRARLRVRVVGSQDSVCAAVDRPVRRASGLRHPLPDSGAM